MRAIRTSGLIERGWETGRRFGVGARAHPRLYKVTGPPNRGDPSMRSESLGWVRVKPCSERYRSALGKSIDSPTSSWTHKRPTPETGPQRTRETGRGQAVGLPFLHPQGAMKIS